MVVGGPGRRLTRVGNRRFGRNRGMPRLRQVLSLDLVLVRRIKNHHARTERAGAVAVKNAVALAKLVQPLGVAERNAYLNAAGVGNRSGRKYLRILKNLAVIEAEVESRRGTALPPLSLNEAEKLIRGTSRPRKFDLQLENPDPAELRRGLATVPGNSGHHYRPAA